MKTLRKFLAAVAVFFTAAVHPALAVDLTNTAFVRQATDRANFEPGGKYHLFGSRGGVAERSGGITATPAVVHQIGNLEFSRSRIQGDIGYTVRFSGHGHEVHAPFDNHAARSASERSGSILSGGAASYRLDWSTTPPTATTARRAAAIPPQRARGTFTTTKSKAPPNPPG